MSEKLSPLEKLARKNKLPTVMELLTKSLESTGITYLAKELDFEYTNLSAVMRGKRKLPLNPSILLAQKHGYTDVDGLFMHAYQDLYPDEKTEKPKKPRGLPANSPLRKTSSLLTKKAAAK